MTALAPYDERRGRLETYFNRTAVDAWAQLTSNSPVSRIRETVRQGRDQMRGQLLSWLPDDMSRSVLLDAGCGTGALSVAAAHRGATVIAVDIAGNLVDLARERAPDEVSGAISFRVGDMLSPDQARANVESARIASRNSSALSFTLSPRRFNFS